MNAKRLTTAKNIIKEKNVSKQLIKAQYGKVKLLRARCEECDQIALIIDGRFTCCDNKPPKFTEEIEKRMIPGVNKRERILDRTKKEILLKQDYKCIYCNCNLDNAWFISNKIDFPRKIRIHFDHFIPWNYTRSSYKDELFASCHICNGIKSNKHFKDIEEAKEYILDRRDTKGIITL